MLKKRSLVVPLFVGLFILLIPVLIAPQVQLLFETSREIEEGKARLIRLEDKRSKLASAGEEGLREKFFLASSALPSSKDVGIVLVALDALAQKHGVTFVNFSTSALDDSSKQNLGSNTSPAILVTVTVRGDRDDTSQLIEELERSLPLMKVRAIAVVKKDTALSLESYYKPIVSSLPPSDSPLVPFSDFNQIIATLSSFTKQTSFVEASPTTPDRERLPSKERANPFF